MVASAWVLPLIKVGMIASKRALQMAPLSRSEGRTERHPSNLKPAVKPERKVL